MKLHCSDFANMYVFHNVDLGGDFSPFMAFSDGEAIGKLYDYLVRLQTASVDLYLIGHVVEVFGSDSEMLLQSAPRKLVFSGMEFHEKFRLMQMAMMRNFIKLPYREGLPFPAALRGERQSFEGCH